MDVGLPHASRLRLYLVIQFCTVTNTTKRKFTLFGKKSGWGGCSTGGLFLRVPGLKELEVCVGCAWGAFIASPGSEESLSAGELSPSSIASGLWPRRTLALGWPRREEEHCCRATGPF